jgi:hypothetical protein
MFNVMAEVIIAIVLVHGEDPDIVIHVIPFLSKTSGCMLF